MGFTFDSIHRGQRTDTSKGENTRLSPSHREAAQSPCIMSQAVAFDILCHSGNRPISLLSYATSRSGPCSASLPWRPQSPEPACLSLQVWSPCLGHAEGRQTSKALSVGWKAQSGAGRLPSALRGPSFCLACGQATMEQQVKCEQWATLTHGACQQPGRDRVWRMGRDQRELLRQESISQANSWPWARMLYWFLSRIDSKVLNRPLTLPAFVPGMDHLINIQTQCHRRAISLAGLNGAKPEVAE